MSVTTEPKLSDGAESQRLRLDASGRRSGEAPADPSSKGALRAKIVLGVLVAIGVVVVIVAVVSLAGSFTGPEQALVLEKVKRGNLAITVTERGNLESQNNVKVICEVDDIEGDGIQGTPILMIVPNGSSVKKDDVLVQLESAKHQERLDRQVLATEKAKSEEIQWTAKYANQITQNATALAAAELKIKLAKLELEMYEDPEKGTYQLEVETINRLIDDINNQILEAQASLELKKNDLRGIERLFKLGYKGKSDLERTQLEFLQAESSYSAQLNKLKTQMATLKKKETYERQMELLTLQGAQQTANRNYEQVIEDNKALLKTAEAANENATEALKKEQERLERYQKGLDNCTILAPTDGMVAYATGSSWRRSEIRQGSAVTQRQHIISLPNLKKMQVQTAVHESVLDEVKAGLPATIRVDAFPEKSYKGTVQSVAVLPQQGGHFGMGSDTKVYKTTVTVDEEVQQLKPGMTAVVEIHVAHLKDVLTIQVQAIVQVGRKSWCYVKRGGAVERCEVELGRTNTKFIEIRKGLEAGDMVVLNPEAVMGEDDQEDPAASEEDSSPPAEGEGSQTRPSKSPSDAPSEGAGRPSGAGRPEFNGESGGGAGTRPAGSAKSRPAGSAKSRPAGSSRSRPRPGGGAPRPQP
ncbi:MAG: efflux RND transporter periplasmic adaptor subunit [Candidatus Nealsonbacteria bacterium]|nr:efflux RND transporter periplasmic adaptor subunit [Candidatus Nealsonbacteria bacterium]